MSSSNDSAVFLALLRPLSVPWVSVPLLRTLSAPWRPPMTSGRPLEQHLLPEVEGRDDRATVRSFIERATSGSRCLLRPPAHDVQSPRLLPTSRDALRIASLRRSVAQASCSTRCLWCGTRTAPEGSPSSRRAPCSRAPNACAAKRPTAMLSPPSHGNDPNIHCRALTCTSARGASRQCPCPPKRRASPCDTWPWCSCKSLTTPP